MPLTEREGIEKDNLSLYKELYGISLRDFFPDILSKVQLKENLLIEFAIRHVNEDITVIPANNYI